MKKFYSFLITALIATVAAFQANAYTLTMNVTGADLLDFEWTMSGSSYSPTITEGVNTISSTDFGESQYGGSYTWFSFNIIPKKENVKLTVTDVTDIEVSDGYVSLNDTGTNGKQIYAYGGDIALEVVAEEFELVEYPVHFEFVNYGTEDYLKGVYVNDVLQENFMAEDFKVMAGSKLYFSFDTDKYGRDYDADEHWCYRNGEAWDNPAASSWYSNNETVTGETTYSFRVKPNPVFDVTFKINTPGSAEVSIDNGVSEVLNETETIKKVFKKGEADVQIIVKGYGDYGIKSVKRIVDGQAPVEESKSYGNYYLYFKDSYGNCTYEIETTPKDELRTASCIVNIDDNADNVLVTRDRVEIPVTKGDNTIKFDPDNTYEKYISISTKDYTPFYQVLVDGKKQTSYSSSSYSVDITDGCRVEVKTIIPDTPAKFTFEFVNEGTEDFISSIYVGEESVDLTSLDFANGLDVVRGSYVSMRFNTEKYKVNKIWVNDAEQWGTYSWNGTIFDDQAFKFDVEPYPTINATINIDKPQFVCVRENSSSYGNIIALQPGENKYSYTGSMEPTLYFMPCNGGEITSAKADDYDMIFNDYNSCYTVDIVDGMVIDITANGPERDKTAMFWSDAKAGADGELYALYLRSANSELGYSYLPIDIDTNYKEGYKQFDFLEAENPFCVGTTPITPKVYLNNEEVIDDGGWNFTLAQDDVVKIYLYKEPANCAISFDVPAEIADAISVTSDRVRKEAAYTTGVNVLEGAEINIASSEEANIKGVTVDGTAVEPNEDGSYTFVASANHSVVINAESGIIAIEGDNAPAKVYNLQGIRVASDLDKLPAGFYIVNGAKVYVK